MQKRPAARARALLIDDDRLRAKAIENIGREVRRKANDFGERISDHAGGRGHSDTAIPGRATLLSRIDQRIDPAAVDLDAGKVAGGTRKSGIGQPTKQHHCRRSARMPDMNWLRRAGSSADRRRH